MTYAIERHYTNDPQREAVVVREKPLSYHLSDEEILARRTLCCRIDDLIEKKDFPLEKEESKVVKRKAKKRANSRTK